MCFLRVATQAQRPGPRSARLQPERNGRVRCSTRLGIISGSFLLFPSPPGIEQPHRRADEANPCQRRRFCEQPTGKSGIDNCSDKIDIPRNLALFFQRCVAWRCHSRAPMRPVMLNYNSTSQSLRHTQQKWSVQTRSRCALRRGTTADGSLVAQPLSPVPSRASTSLRPKSTPLTRRRRHSPYANALRCKTTFP